MRSPLKYLYLGFLLNFLLLLIMTILALLSLGKMKKTTELVSHTDEVILKLERLYNGITDAETSQRGYLLTANSQFLTPFIGSYDRVTTLLAEIDSLTKDNVTQQKRIDTLGKLIEKRFDILNHGIEISQQHGFETARKFVNTSHGNQVMDSIRLLLFKLKEEEFTLRDVRRVHMAEASKFSTLILLIFGLIGLTTGILGFITTRRDLKRRFEAEEKLKEAYGNVEKLNRELTRKESQLQATNTDLEQRVEERTIEIKSKNVALRRTNADLDSFIYSASHDLKAPISNLEGLISALETDINEGCSPDTKTLLMMMSTSVERLKSTIYNLGDIDRLRNLDAEDKENINMNDVIKSFHNEYQLMVKGSGVEIKTDFKVEQITFSRRSLQLILNNLLTNAINFRSAESHPYVIVSTWKTKENEVVITVEDNGIGIKKENVGQLFGLFKKLHHPREGSGIGLYIVKRLVENAGGIIEVETSHGKGSRFSVILPQ